MFKKLSAHFLPRNIASTDEKRKALLLVNFTLLLSGFSLVYLFVCYFTNIIVGVYTNLIMFPLCLVALFVFKYTKTFGVSSSIAILGFTAGIAEGVLFTGNIASPAFTWIIMSPSIDILFGNIKSGIIWTIVIVCLFAVFGVFKITNIHIPYLFPLYLQNYILTFTFIAVTVFSSIVIAIYNSTRTFASKALMEEKEKSDSLLLNILPVEIANELRATGQTKAKHYNAVTVMFTDFVNFTKAGERMSPQELVLELHNCFKVFDEIIGKYNIEKIKTIGDAYLAVCGLPKTNEYHAENIVNAACEIKQFIHKRKQELGDKTFDIRIGIHSGPVVAGIVGIKKFAYDIRGETVNTAARMEQSG
jgi:class 3 adenylate cyclase